MIADFGMLAPETEKVISDYRTVAGILERTYVAMGRKKVITTSSETSSKAKIHVKSANSSNAGVRNSNSATGKV